MLPHSVCGLYIVLQIEVPDTCKSDEDLDVYAGEVACDFCKLNGLDLAFWFYLVGPDSNPDKFIALAVDDDSILIKDSNYWS